MCKEERMAAIKKTIIGVDKDIQYCFDHIERETKECSFMMHMDYMRGFAHAKDQKKRLLAELAILQGG